MTFNYLGTNSFIGTFQGSVHSELSGTGNITNTTRLARDNYTLPADVIFYAPLNDPIGHPVTQAATFSSMAGSTKASLLTNVWNHGGTNQNGAFVADPHSGGNSSTAPFGYATCYNGGGSYTQFRTSTEQGKSILFDRVSGTGINANVRNISIEFFYYLGTNSFTGSYPRLFLMGDYADSGDGFAAEALGTYDNRISFYHYFGSATNRIGVGLQNMGTNRWKYLRMCLDLDNDRRTVHHGNTDDSGGVARRFNEVADRNNDFTLAGRNLATCQLNLGEYRDSTRGYTGGFNEVIIRVDDPDAETKNDADPLTVPSSPLISF